MDQNMMIQVNTILSKGIMPSSINIGTMSRAEGEGMDTGSTGVTCSYPILYTAVAVSHELGVERGELGAESREWRVGRGRLR